MSRKIDDWKKEAGDIPSNTCPDIDKMQKEIKDIVKRLEQVSKELAYMDNQDAKSLSSEVSDIATDIEWLDLEDLRKDNSQLRDLGVFWYEKCKDLYEDIECLI